MLWYHDHAMGTSRLNLYAGMMGVYLLRDAHEASLNLPVGSHELLLILYDRIFDQDSQLFYPVSPLPDRPWIDEVVGDAMVVNGQVQPFHEGRAAPLSVALAERGERAFLPPGAVPWRRLPADRGRSGVTSRPVKLATLLLAPGERADLIVDFAPLRGERVTLTNGPFQMMQFRVGSAPAQDRSHVTGSPAASRPPVGDFRGANARTDLE